MQDSLINEIENPLEHFMRNCALCDDLTLVCVSKKQFKPVCFNSQCEHNENLRMVGVPCHRAAEIREMRSEK